MTFVASLWHWCLPAFCAGSLSGPKTFHGGGSWGLRFRGEVSDKVSEDQTKQQGIFKMVLILEKASPRIRLGLKFFVTRLDSFFYSFLGLKKNLWKYRLNEVLKLRPVPPSPQTPIISISQSWDFDLPFHFVT